MSHAVRPAKPPATDRDTWKLSNERQDASRKLPGFSESIVTLMAELDAQSMQALGTLVLAWRDVRMTAGRDAIWVIVRRDGLSGVAFRAAHTPGGATGIKSRVDRAGTDLTMTMDSAQGRHSLQITTQLNSGFIFFHRDEPAFGSVLYFQNLTALDDYFAAKKTIPDTATGSVCPNSAIFPLPRPTPKRSRICGVVCFRLNDDPANTVYQ